MTTIGDSAAQARRAALREASLAHDLLGLRSTVAEVLLTRTHRVVVDVSALSRPSSSAVAALLWAKRSCTRAGVEFTVHGARPANRDVLRRCGLLGADDRGAS
ncbi:hypothetical protein GCM10027517_07860 [Phycicoccus ginsengisoli]